MRAVQRTNFAQVCPVPDPRGGRVTVFGVIDNLGKGAAGQAAPEPEPDGGASRDRGPALSLPPVLRDDWIARAGGPRAGARAARSRRRPGFRAAGVACGLKPSGALDLGLLRSPASGGLGAGRHGERAAVGARSVHNRGLDRAACAPWW